MPHWWHFHFIFIIIKHFHLRWWHFIDAAFAAPCVGRCAARALCAHFAFFSMTLFLLLSLRDIIFADDIIIDIAHYYFHYFHFMFRLQRQHYWHFLSLRWLSFHETLLLITPMWWCSAPMPFSHFRGQMMRALLKAMPRARWSATKMLYVTFARDIDVTLHFRWWLLPMAESARHILLFLFRAIESRVDIIIVLLHYTMCHDIFIIFIFIFVPLLRLYFHYEILTHYIIDYYLLRRAYVDAAIFLRHYWYYHYVTLFISLFRHDDYVSTLHYHFIIIADMPRLLFQKSKTFSLMHYWHYERNTFDMRLWVIIITPCHRHYAIISFL